jgi:hypothetical protein
MTSRTERTIAELCGDALSQLAKLITNEFDLAKAELSQKATDVGRGAAMIGAGALVMIPALVILLFGVATWMIADGFSASAAYFVTGGLSTVFAAVLIGLGASHFSSRRLRPSITLDQIKQDQAAVKEMAQ